MKTHPVIMSGLASLLLGVSIPGALAQTPAERAAPAQAQPAAPAPAQPAGQPDASGRIAAPGAAALAALPPPPPSHACLQLHNGAAVFNFDVLFDPNVTGFPIKGGTITGNLCNASQWHITASGNLGPNLALAATRPAGGGCADHLTVAGNYANPSSYTGTYGFPGTGFTQHTLFLGFNKTSCP